MGAYLHIGFIAKARTNIPSNLSKKEVTDDLEDYYSKETFDCKESNGQLVWTVKPKVIKSELAEFVQQFNEDYYGKISEKWLNQIRELAKSTNWLEKAEEEEDPGFFVVTADDDDCFNVGRNKVKIRLKPTAIILSSEGKFLMEDSECTLQFLETCAQRAFSNFKLGKAIRVYVW